MTNKSDMYRQHFFFIITINIQWSCYRGIIMAWVSDIVTFLLSFILVQPLSHLLCFYFVVSSVNNLFCLITSYDVHTKNTELRPISLWFLGWLTGCWLWVHPAIEQPFLLASLSPSIISVKDPCNCILAYLHTRRLWWV